jgi:hypothetical protein
LNKLFVLIFLLTLGNGLVGFELGLGLGGFLSDDLSGDLSGFHFVQAYQS